MNLPKKITPDNIKDAIVEVKYESEAPFEWLIGIMAEAFDQTWTYTNRPIPTRPGVPLFAPNAGQELTIRIGTEYLLYNDHVNIRILPNSFVISCVNKPYPGWPVFARELNKALTVIHNTGKIRQWTRVGVRYISHYQETDLRKCVSFNFSFGLPGIVSDSIAFRSEFSYRDTKVILNLSSMVPLVVQPEPNQFSAVIPTSIIDIDVITDGLKLTELGALLNVIEDNHTKEKELYFGMINEEYLKAVKPEY